MDSSSGGPDDGDSTAGRRSKVSRVANTYGLSGLGNELERRWLGRGGDRQSLRELANHVNRRILAAVLAEAQPAVDGEIANYYRLLTDESVSASARAEAETRLARVGADIEAIQEDFVSHQAVHNYLTDVRQVDYPSEQSRSDEVVSSRRDAIQRLRSRLAAVTKRSLYNLERAGHITLGSFEVLVRLSIYCSDCGATQDVATLLQNGGCDCGMDAGRAGPPSRDS